MNDWQGWLMKPVQINKHTWLDEHGLHIAVPGLGPYRAAEPNPLCPRCHHAIDASVRDALLLRGVARCGSCGRALTFRR